MLFQYEQAAWHSTDAVRAMQPPEGTVRRYIARQLDDGHWVVSFGRLNEQRDKFLVAYDAAQGASPVQFEVKKYDPPREDVGFCLFAARAIDVALVDFKGERRPYNVAVLPADAGQMYIYVYPAQTATGVYPLGGDFRYLISQDGSKIVEKRQFHKSILEIRNSDKDAGKRVVGGFHTHVLDDVPDDTDVLYVLERKPAMPEFIGTRSHTYQIEIDGTIKVLK